MEKDVLNAEEYGLETLGVTRVPLHVMSEGRGFPAFMRNNFVGNSKEQLIKGLKRADIQMDYNFMNNDL